MNIASHDTWLAGLMFLMVVAIAYGFWSALESAEEPELRADLLAWPLDTALGGDTTMAKYDERAFERVIANGAGMTKMFFNVGQQLFKTIWEPARDILRSLDAL